MAASPGEVLRPEDPNAIDSDGDGLSDTEEVALGTDAVKSDTDGDGLADVSQLFLEDFHEEELTNPETKCISDVNKPFRGNILPIYYKVKMQHDEIAQVNWSNK